ncbi:hypothetical protein LJC49_02920 [Ruminococcaceae bacterium OttesenSCG-928-I18]|nr:hypothetical protein [Ruminococcaceae bacterium OttesenSCG-928-I18]
MISRDVWEDKLIEDKVKYYNRTRMSIEMFCRKIPIGEMQFRDEMRDNDYFFDEQTRKFMKQPPIELTYRRFR